MPPASVSPVLGDCFTYRTILMSKINPMFSKGDIVRFKQGMFHFLVLATPEHCQHHGAPAYMGLTVGSDQVQFYTQTYLEIGDWFVLPKNRADEVRHWFYPSDNIEIPHENKRRDLPPDYLFPEGRTILHKKSGGRYTVIVGPDLGRLEATNTPAYIYKSQADGLVWARAQSEMEDGRFELVWP